MQDEIQNYRKIYPKLDTIRSISFNVQIALLKIKNLLREFYDLIQDIKKTELCLMDMLNII